MINLKSYITEGIFDEEDILDDIDKNAEYHKWYKLLTNPDTFADTFDNLWTMIGREAKEVKKSHIPTLPQSNVYIVFQKNEQTLSKKKYILKCFTKYDTEQYAVASIIGSVVTDDNHKRKCIKYWPDFSGFWLDDILPKKSIFNRMIARQIYVLPEKYKFIYKLLYEYREKSK